MCPARYGQQVARLDIRIPGVTIEWDKGISVPPTPENEIGQPVPPAGCLQQPSICSSPSCIQSLALVVGCTSCEPQVTIPVAMQT